MSRQESSVFQRLSCFRISRIRLLIKQKQYVLFSCAEIFLVRFSNSRGKSNRYWNHKNFELKKGKRSKKIIHYYPHFEYVNFSNLRILNLIDHDYLFTLFPSGKFICYGPKNYVGNYKFLS